MCLIEEHVMASSRNFGAAADAMVDLTRAEDGPKGLAAEGDLPECFASIRREMEEAQRRQVGRCRR